MIVNAGVLIDADDAPELAAVLAEVIRARRDTPTLRRLHSELAAIRSANSGRDVARPEPVWLDIHTAGSLLGRSERTIRRWCASGRIEATKEGRSWQVAATEHGEPIWRTGSSAHSAPR